jgi:proline iminopeptidase
MYARIRGTDIYFDIDGAGLVVDGARMRERLAAFVIHGGPGVDHTGLKARMGGLRDRMQVVYFDHRGQGRSARSDSKTYCLDENVEDLEALREHLGLGPIVSIGTSYGGMVAMAHAARYPGSVSHLILVATAAHAGFIQRSKEIVALRGTSEQISMCEEVWAGRIDTAEKYRRYFEVMGPLYSLKYDSVAARESLQHAILSTDALNRAYAPSGCMRSFDLRPELASVVAPTLIVAGRHDWICAPEFSEEIHRLIRDSDLRVFEESGHSISKDEPQRLLDAIAGFVMSNSTCDGVARMRSL